jgi:cytochrome c-type biogenesis protein CcmH/NrfG
MMLSRNCLRSGLLPLLMASVAAASHAQPPAIPPEVARAQAAMQAGQVDSAITTLETWFSQNPTATVGRILLGNAYRQKGEAQKALDSYEKVTVPRPARIQAMFLMAAVHASASRADTALALL